MNLADEAQKIEYNDAGHVTHPTDTLTWQSTRLAGFSPHSVQRDPGVG
jgi:hypothetical protein